MSRLLILITSILLIGSGCTCVDDPRQGGLLGYCPDAYKQRVNQREDKIQSTNTERKQLEGEGTKLGATKAKKQKELLAQKRSLTKLDKELASARKSLVSARASTASKAKEKKQLRNQLVGLRKKITTLQKSQITSSTQIAERQKQITKLRTEIEQLTEIIVNFAVTGS